MKAQASAVREHRRGEEPRLVRFEQAVLSHGEAPTRPTSSAAREELGGPRLGDRNQRDEEGQSTSPSALNESERQTPYLSDHVLHVVVVTVQVHGYVVPLQQRPQLVLEVRFPAPVPIGEKWVMADDNLVLRFTGFQRPLQKFLLPLGILRRQPPWDVVSPAVVVVLLDEWIGIDEEELHVFARCVCIIPIAEPPPVSLPEAGVKLVERRAVLSF